MDPISDIIIAAAVGAVTTQAVGGITALVKSIVPGLWEHLNPKGKKQLEANLTNFISHFTFKIALRQVNFLRSRFMLWTTTLLLSTCFYELSNKRP